MVTAACPDLDELSALASGHLSDDRLEVLSRHLEGCPDCLSSLESLGGDPLSLDLRRPYEDPYSDEPGLHKAQERVRAMGNSQAAPFAGFDADALPSSLGAYEILGLLGRGGMGTVYHARHRYLQREVALKVLPAGRLGDPGAVTRFLREMQAAGALSHPNIVQASDAGEADGVHYLVMEYVPGTDLERLVSQGGPLAVADAAEVARQAAEGLEHVRRCGLVHRDIKPSNLLLTPDGRVKVLDLGLARLREGLAPDDGLSRIGQVMGTAAYMAPEQAVDTHTVDTRADLYSLGCTLFFLLTGRPPFHRAGDRNPLRTLLAHGQTPAPSVRAARRRSRRALARSWPGCWPSGPRTGTRPPATSPGPSPRSPPGTAWPSRRARTTSARPPRRPSRRRRRRPRRRPGRCRTPRRGPPRNPAPRRPGVGPRLSSPSPSAWWRWGACSSPGRS